MTKFGRSRTPRQVTQVATVPPPARDHAPSRIPRGTVVLVGVAAVTITAIGMSGIRGILAPVLLTLVLVICASPVRTYLERKGFPQGIATGAVILVVFALLAGFALILV